MNTKNNSTFVTVTWELSRFLYLFFTLTEIQRRVFIITGSSAAYVRKAKVGGRTLDCQLAEINQADIRFVLGLKFTVISPKG